MSRTRGVACLVYFEQPLRVFDEAVSMGRSMGLEVESEDVHELVKSNEIKYGRVATPAGKTLAEDLSSDEVDTSSSSDDRSRQIGRVFRVPE